MITITQHILIACSIQNQKSCFDMILPTKHISIRRSVIYFGAVILKHLKTRITVTSLWERIKQSGEIRNYEDFTLALDFLYILNLIDYQNGQIRRVKNA